MKMKLVRKTVTKEVEGQVRTYVNVILVTDDGLRIPVKSSFPNDAKLLRQLAKDE
jgi:hypothetical protein